MKARKFLAGAAALGLLLGAAGTARADVVTNDVAVVDSDRIVTVVKGGAAQEVKWSVAASNVDPVEDANGCNATGGNPATLTPTIATSPAGVTTSAPSVQIVGCDNAYGLSFSASNAATAGDYNVTVALTGGKSGSLWNTSAAAFKLRVVDPPVTSVAPTVSYTLDPAAPDGDNGWYKGGTVGLSWTITGTPTPTVDAGADCGPQSIDTDGEHSFTCAVTNAAGSDSDTAVINYDATAPTNIQFVGGPADGGTYYADDLPAAPTCTADDTTSGLDDCAVTGYGTGFASHTLTATATDIAGNSDTATRSYTVAPWTASGYHSPVRMGLDFVNQVKGGSTVPLKFNVYKGVTEVTDVTKLGSTPFSVMKYTCDGGDDTGLVTETTAGNTVLRYADTQFIQNWKTPTTKGCYRATMALPYGAGSIVAQFQVK